MAYISPIQLIMVIVLVESESESNIKYYVHLQ